MKAQNVLQAHMRDAYKRFQGSHLSQKAFCQAEGISKGKFNYWCRQFKQTTSSPPIITEKAKVEKKANQPTEASGFTPISLPITQTPTPLMVLDLAGKGRLEFYCIYPLCTITLDKCTTPNTYIILTRSLNC